MATIGTLSSKASANPVTKFVAPCTCHLTLDVIRGSYTWARSGDADAHPSCHFSVALCCKDLRLIGHMSHLASRFLKLRPPVRVGIGRF